MYQTLPLGNFLRRALLKLGASRSLSLTIAAREQVLHLPAALADDRGLRDIAVPFWVV